MSLLSSVARRIYWTARYLERAETSARLARVYGNLLLDLPPEAGVDWGLLNEINGNDPLFRSTYPDPEPDSAERFFTADRANPSSLLSSLAEARENIRTTRDVIPSEAWRSVNELYLFVTAEVAAPGWKRKRYGVHSTIVEGCQQITGLLVDTMSHGPAYQFFRLGRTIERADMTTRILDVAAATLLTGREELQRFDNALWMAVLQSLSAYQMYRQHVRRRIVGQDVIGFLLHDRQFPRAFKFCLTEIEAALGSLPRNRGPLERIEPLKGLLEQLDVEHVDNAALHQWLDDAQLELAALHDVVHETWFAPAAR